jgi:hypothetical protein
MQGKEEENTRKWKADEMNTRGGRKGGSAGEKLFSRGMCCSRFSLEERKKKKKRKEMQDELNKNCARVLKCKGIGISFHWKEMRVKVGAKEGGKQNCGTLEFRREVRPKIWRERTKGGAGGQKKNSSAFPRVTSQKQHPETALSKLDDSWGNRATQRAEHEAFFFFFFNRAAATLVGATQRATHRLQILCSVRQQGLPASSS